MTDIVGSVSRQVAHQCHIREDPSSKDASRGSWPYY